MNRNITDIAGINIADRITADSGVVDRPLSGPRAVWIDWGQHLRTQTLSSRLDVALEEVLYSGGRVGRYLRSARRTLDIIRERRPTVVIATNPSIVLGLLLLLLRKAYGFRLISDAHYAGVTAFNDGWFLQRLLDFHNLHADVVVVTNENQARALARRGTRTYVCQDPLPDHPARPESGVSVGERSALLICSFQPDEPYEAVFEAFGRLQKDGVTLFVSGNYKKASIDPSRFPWVRFLGFLPTDQYYEYLQSVSVVLDLTTLEDCLVCGAYEALAAHKPLILSKTAASNEYFGDAAALTDNTANAIHESVLWALAHRTELAERARDWVARNIPYMDSKVAGLRALLAGSKADGA